MRRYILPIALQSELQREKHTGCTDRGISRTRCTSYAQQTTADDNTLNVSISSLSESGYDGDMEDEGDLTVNDVLPDEELSCEFVDEENSVLNKQSKDSSFLKWDVFSRMSSTPSILHPAGFDGAFNTEVQNMETDFEPVPIDNEICSANELCTPIAMEPNEAMELGESCPRPIASNVQRRQPLRAIQNNVCDRTSMNLKSQRRASAWTKSVTN